MSRWCSWRALLLLGVSSLFSLSLGCHGGALSVDSTGDDSPGSMKSNNKPGVGQNNKPGPPNGPGPRVDEIDPGRVTLHRLNRDEYNRTVRDLLGMPDISPADVFPPDDFGYGFNNIADVLTLSPQHLEFYDKAADELIEAAMKVSSGSTKTRFEAETANPTLGGASGDFWNLWSNGELGQQVSFPETGRYTIKVRAYGQQAGPDPARMELLDGVNVLQTFDVTATNVSPAIYEYTGQFEAGNRRIGVGFINDFYDQPNGADRNLLVDWVEVEGPIGAQTSSATRDKIMVCQPSSENDKACVRQIFEAFALRAWRRPATSAELDRLLEFVDDAQTQGDGVEEGIRTGLKAILLSPKFIFRVEEPKPEAQDKPYVLSQYEFATRLSYFIWSAAPDETLLELAAQGQLSDEATVRAQIKRMLQDERAVALLDNFATQWLYIDAVLEVTPDYQVYPDFTPALARDMREETRRFVWELIERDAPLTELLQGQFTYLTRRLAQHYGITGVDSDTPVRVELDPATRRRGLLTHGGLLTARSFPNRTSPVKRGVWVLEQVMCSAPPPAPANVEGLREEGVEPGATLRERLEQHRADPSCYGCHAVMDPIGFGLENYDGTGAWREKDNGADVDSLGELPDGRSFTGALELAEVLANDPKLIECATEKTMTYALGRGVYAKFGQDDYAQVHHIAEILEQKGATMHELITQIVLSDAFRMRTNESAQADADGQ